MKIELEKRIREVGIQGRNLYNIKINFTLR